MVWDGPNSLLEDLHTPIARGPRQLSAVIAQVFQSSDARHHHVVNDSEDVSDEDPTVSGAGGCWSCPTPFVGHQDGNILMSSSCAAHSEDSCQSVTWSQP